MNAAEKIRLHVAIAQALRSQGDSGLNEDQLLLAQRIAGFDLSLPALQVELRALADQNVIAAFTPLSGKRYRLTAIGESKLAEAGL
jgi:hypothetical protein